MEDVVLFAEEFADKLANVVNDISCLKQKYHCLPETFYLYNQFAGETKDLKPLIADLCE